MKRTQFQIKENKLFKIKILVKLKIIKITKMTVNANNKIKMKVNMNKKSKM